MFDALLAMQRQVHQGQPHFQPKPAPQSMQQAVQAAKGQRADMTPADACPSSSKP
jgi:hypothetical protein